MRLHGQWQSRRQSLSSLTRHHVGMTDLHALCARFAIVPCPTGSARYSCAQGDGSRLHCRHHDPMHRWYLLEDAELRVYSRRGLDHPQRFQVSLLDTSLREQSQALAQQHGHDADVDFVT